MKCRAWCVSRGWVLFRCIGEHCRALDVHSIFLGTVKDGSGQFRLEIFGAIPEISLGSSHVCCVRHGVFTPFRKSIDAVGEFFTLLVGYTVAHVGNIFELTY